MCIKKVIKKTHSGGSQIDPPHPVLLGLTLGGCFKSTKRSTDKRHTISLLPQSYMKYSLSSTTSTSKAELTTRLAPFYHQKHTQDSSILRITKSTQT